MSEMPEHERSVAEEFRITAHKYVDAQAAADSYEEMKTTTLEQMKTALILEHGEMADNKAERTVKSSPAWEEYLRAMLEARKVALKFKLQLDWIRMKERIEDRQSWLQRSEHKMGRSVP